MKRLSLAIVLLGVWTTAAMASPEPRTKVFLNGVPAPVYFNDGDSFRVLSGQYMGMRTRLAGFNTLENHGPVHRWGDFHVKELYINSQQGTLHARRGVWHCESDLAADTYGRTLWWCPDLAVDLVRLGLAHAMSIDRNPARPELVAAQQEAIAARRGMWAHGVPDYIITSTHSKADDVEGRGTRNRLVSSRDGHSILWEHDRTYGECEEVCDIGWESTWRLEEAHAILKANTGLAELLAAYDEARLHAVMLAFAMNQAWRDKLVDAAHAGPLGAAFEALRQDRRLGRLGPPSCMIYTDFRRRYSGSPPRCLRW